MIQWIRPLDTSGTFTGINDSSIYTFKDRKYEGLAREVLQNSLDEQLFLDMPVKVEFRLFHIPVSDIPGIETYRELFADSLDYWKNDNQENGRVFFSQALELLESPTIPILRISDFNTNGVLGSSRKNITSSKDITPWFNLIKSEGSSSKGGTQGGSFGIGKNATFANSSLRTVFYSTSDRERVDAYEGIAKLATVYKHGRQLSHKAFFGQNDNDTSHAIPGLLHLDPEFRRLEYGTDIFILGFEEESDWKFRMLISILTDFLLPLQNQSLEVILDGDRINHTSLSSIFEEYTVKLTREANAVTKHALRNAYNFYQVITSAESQTFEQKLDNYGKAVLKVLFNPEFDRKIMRTRETGMKLFSKGNISSSIGFSGIVSLQGDALNKLFRKMENPAHTAWSPDNVDAIKEKIEAKRMLLELDRWMRQTILDNAYDEKLESQEIEGLGDYLPADFNVTEVSRSKNQAEVISPKINQITAHTPSRKELLTKDDTANTNDGFPDDDGESGESRQPIAPSSKEKGGSGSYNESGVSMDETGTARRKVALSQYRSRLMLKNDVYVLILSPACDINNAHISVKVAGENSAEPLWLHSARKVSSDEAIPISGHQIAIGDLEKNTRTLFELSVKTPERYALEVELYEHTI